MVAKCFGFFRIQVWDQLITCEKLFQPIKSLINTFRLSEKWNDLEVQTPKMKLAVEKVSIMVPGVTREFGTFSIFRRNGLKVEFLVEQSSRDENGDLVTTHDFVDFDSPARVISMFHF